MAYVLLSCTTLDRNLWLVPNNAELAYPQIDNSPTPISPDEPVYINVPYPEIANTISRYLWMQNTGLLPIRGNYEPDYPIPDAPTYINVPLYILTTLGNRQNLTTFDSYTVADQLWVDTINGEVTFTIDSDSSFLGAIAVEGEVLFTGELNSIFDNTIITNNLLSAILSPTKHYLTKIEWLDWNENIIADYTADVIDGNLSIDASRNIRRSFSMTVNNSDGSYMPNGTRTNMRNKVRIKRGIQTEVGTIWHNRGIFVLSNPSAKHSRAEQTVDIEGLDKWALFDGSLAGTITETTVIANGTNVAEAIRAVAEDAGETKFNFDICTVATPYTITKEPGDTIADLLLELALIPSWDLYYDVNGYLRFCPITDPLQKQIVADLSVGGVYRKCYVSSEYNPEWSKIKNYWHVIGLSDSDTGIIYDGVAQNNNPDSATNTSTPPDGIGKKATQLTDTNLTTDSLCSQRAAYELRKNLTKIDRSSHNILPLPFLNEGDCVQLEDVNTGIDDYKYEIQSIKEPLGLGLMQIETWKCTSVFEIVAFDDFQLGIGTWQQLQNGGVDIVGFSGNNCLRKINYNDPNGGYKLLDKSCTDFELVTYTRRDSVTTGNGINAYSIVDSTGTGYGISLDYENDLLIVNERTLWIGSTLASIVFNPALEQWYTLRLIKMSSNLLAEIYLGKTLEFGSPLVTVSVYDETTTLFDRECVNGGYPYFTDDTTVRKLL